MNLSKFDKNQNRGTINFGAVMDIEATIFTTPTAAKNKYTTDKTGATQKANLADITTNNPNK